MSTDTMPPRHYGPALTPEARAARLARETELVEMLQAYTTSYGQGDPDSVRGAIRELTPQLRRMRRHVRRVLRDEIGGEQARFLGDSLFAAGAEWRIPSSTAWAAICECRCDDVAMRARMMREAIARAEDTLERYAPQIDAAPPAAATAA